MPQIVAVRTNDDPSRETIAVVLSQDAICLDPDGQPWPAVSLSSEEARRFAARLVSLALEIEEHGESTQQESADSLADIASILVLHDGSERSHRAFRLALELASASLAPIQLAGIFGVKGGSLEASKSPEDYLWQRGWLERLFQLYSDRAAIQGIELRTVLVAANDHESLSRLFGGGRFDFIVLPFRFSETGSECGASKAFGRSLSGATKSKVLFCP